MKAEQKSGRKRPKSAGQQQIQEAGRKLEGLGRWRIGFWIRNDGDWRALGLRPLGTESVSTTGSRVAGHGHQAREAVGDGKGAGPGWSCRMHSRGAVGEGLRQGLSAGFRVAMGCRKVVGWA
jgi:hypothetical protein